MGPRGEKPCRSLSRSDDWLRRQVTREAATGEFRLGMGRQLG